MYIYVCLMHKHICSADAVEGEKQVRRESLASVRESLASVRESLASVRDNHASVCSNTSTSPRPTSQVLIVLALLV